MTDSNVPAGWYPAPHANGAQRYWDGARWLDWTPEQAAAAQRDVTSASPGPAAASTPGEQSHADDAAGGLAPTGDAAPPVEVTGVAGQPIIVRPPRGLALSALIVGIIAVLAALVPVLGTILAIAAIVLGIIALVRQQPRGLSITGLALGAVALLVSVIMLVVFAAIGAASTATGERSVPAITSSPEATEEQSEPSPEPEPEPEAEIEPEPVDPLPTTPDLATFGTVDERSFALIAKEPDSHIGTNLIVYGSVSQLDSATGPCMMLLSAAEAEKENSFDYGQNTLATSGDGEVSCPVFDPLVEGDHVKMWVTVLGSFSYDTQIGGNTTVPAFEVWQAELLAPQEY